MSVKTNVLAAGGIAAVIGIGKQLTRGVDIPGWLTLLVWVPVIVMLEFVAVSIFETNEELKAKAAKRAAIKARREAEEAE